MYLILRVMLPCHIDKKNDDDEEEDEEEKENAGRYTSSCFQQLLRRWCVFNFSLKSLKYDQKINKQQGNFFFKFGGKSKKSREAAA